MVGTKMDGTGKVKNFDTIQDDEFILDIGPSTIKKIKKKSMSLIRFYGMARLDILKIKTFLMEQYL